MSQRIDAIFENGVFRPEVPVNFADGQRVSLDVETKPAPASDPADVDDMLDTEFIESCRQKSGGAPSLDAVRRSLTAFTGCASDIISEERDER